MNASTPDLLGAQYHQNLPSLQRAVALAKELGKKVASKGLKNFRIEVYGGGPNPHFVVSDWTRDQIAKARLANPVRQLVEFRALPVGARFKENKANNPEVYQKVSALKYRAVANLQREDSGDVRVFHHPKMEVLSLAGSEPRLPNPARTLSDLPPGSTIELDQHDWLDDVTGKPLFGGGERWRNLDGTPWKGRRRTLTVVIESGSGAKRQTLAFANAEAFPHAFEIGEVEAVQGWGPLVYDILMERATELGSALSPADVNESSSAVWRQYLRRPDVVRQYDPRAGSKAPFEVKSMVFIKQPKLLHELAQASRSGAAPYKVLYERDWKPPFPKKK